MWADPVCHQPSSSDPCRTRGGTSEVNPVASGGSSDINSWVSRPIRSRVKVDSIGEPNCPVTRNGQVIGQPLKRLHQGKRSLIGSVCLPTPAASQLISLGLMDYCPTRRNMGIPALPHFLIFPDFCGW